MKGCCQYGGVCIRCEGEGMVGDCGIEGLGMVEGNGDC